MDYKKGEVIHNENIKALVIDNNETILKLFILNGFYIAEYNNKNNKTYFYYEDNSEKIPQTKFILEGYNLFFNKEETFNNIFTAEFKKENFNDNHKNEYFENIHKRFVQNKIQKSYISLKFLNQISKAFDKYNKEKTFSMEDIKTGSVLTDNLMQTEYFKDNHLNLNDNYWIVITKTKTSFFAIHLEYSIIANFDNNGEIIELLNDVDSRFGKVKRGLAAAGIFNDKNEILVNQVYEIEKIKENHFFKGIKLLNKIELENQKEAIWFNLISNINFQSFNSPMTKEFHFRSITNDILTKFLDKGKESKKYYGYYDVYYQNKSLQETLYEQNIYDRFVYDHYQEKTTIVIYDLLQLKRPKTLNNICNKENYNMKINFIKDEYKKFFEKLKIEVPKIRDYQFKKQNINVTEYNEFLENELNIDQQNLINV